ncbi:vacuolar sorting-associated VTA1 like protein [Chloropicon primus]|uniref:Vacuolar protein sorting-associated protein VTA1 n=1 Tax=Chloropicon primus TaxID=1764295 RepID=A0A5B8MM93_9CHLO|nr:hypothetical protein A3770_04p32930 [Chloropicon primus]UPQ99987.1 vacuolar sorting-associated VTA1 like protein [Chloropicon primus]|mmetsp:Transcript_12599/g.35136  ORF Transcript_12599/g.35136 Transcript_12599/m.35136 type:complete len:387 (+) Transcript_12599:52-1212(+)|eukprot:QDZ20775.1 hypothetical protein A3770_04p32930 [Chloropicon primus]
MAEQRRALLPFLQRAEEVQKVEPRIAYYCRLYAVEEGLKLQNREKAIDELLFSVMDKLEAYKSKNKLDPEEDKLHLEGFALKIFDRADRVDRAGRADMSTCKTFYAASVFMEVCTQFGALDEDLLGKQKYAAWKAADIRKAIREGRKPTVGSGIVEKNYGPGDKVLCKVDEGSVPVEGAVLSSMDNTFMVSLPGGTMQLKGNQLALRVLPGSAVTYSKDGKQEEGKVVSVDVTVWPPSYDVEKSSGGTLGTEEQYITVTAEPPQANLDALNVRDEPAAGVPVSAPASAQPPPPPIQPPAPPASAPHAQDPSPGVVNVRVEPSPSPRAHAQATPAPKVVPGYVPSLLQMNDAQRQAKVAVSSLGFQDYKSAIDYLQRALALLTSPQT